MMEEDAPVVYNFNYEPTPVKESEKPPSP